MQTVSLFVVLLLGACQTVRHLPESSNDASMHHMGNANIFARSELEPRSGSNARGFAWFAMHGEDIKISISVSNATPGDHGIHLHEKGDCSASDASSAGEHFNPGHLKHGRPDPKMFHMGDLGNITVGQNGNGELNLTIPASRLHPHFSDWSIIIGKSLVLHQKVDDLLTQPSGNSGDRIACGVVVSAEIR